MCCVLCWGTSIRRRSRQYIILRDNQWISLGSAGHNTPPSRECFVVDATQFYWTLIPDFSTVLPFRSCPPGIVAIFIYVSLIGLFFILAGHKIINFVLFFSTLPGWLFKISLSSPEELKQLMNESQYEKFLKESDDH